MLHEHGACGLHSHAYASCAAEEMHEPMQKVTVEGGERSKPSSVQWSMAAYSERQVFDSPVVGQQTEKRVSHSRRRGRGDTHSQHALGPVHAGSVGKLELGSVELARDARAVIGDFALRDEISHIKGGSFFLSPEKFRYDSQCANPRDDLRHHGQHLVPWHTAWRGMVFATLYSTCRWLARFIEGHGMEFNGCRLLNTVFMGRPR